MEYDTKIEHMTQFYQIFPYPNRPLWVTPFMKAPFSAHGAFATLVARNKNLFYDFDVTPSDLQEAFPASCKILLVGCGTDEPAIFRALHPQNPLVCIDLSKKNIAIAKRKLVLQLAFSCLPRLFKKTGPTSFVVGDANTILQQRHIESFDYIQCFGVLHHQPRPELLFAGMAEKLAAGGLLRLMLYSYYGRRLERKIQREHEDLWSGVMPLKTRKRRLAKRFFRLKMWQIANNLGWFPTTRLRFRYLGMRSPALADALLHPSDPGFSLERVMPLAAAHQLRLVFCQATVQDRGILWEAFQPHIPAQGEDPCPEIWQQIIQADKAGHLTSNPILIFKKVS